MEDALSDRGTKQLELLKERLIAEEWAFDIIFASPQKRAMQVAEGVREATGADLVADGRLKEIDCGDLTGLDLKKAETLYPEPEGGHKAYKPMPGGESLLEQASRVAIFFMEILDNFKDEKICVVSHGGTMNVIVRLIYDLPIAKPRFPGSSHVFRFADTSISKFRINGSGEVVTWFVNDSCHLKGL